MAEIINLNKRRKAQEQASARTRADANAAKFGRSKAVKSLEAARAERAARTLDAHRTKGQDDA